MTPSEFAAKWAGSTRTERAASQEHFIDLCRMLAIPTPNEADPTGEWYAFEPGVGGPGNLLWIYSRSSPTISQLSSVRMPPLCARRSAASS